MIQAVLALVLLVGSIQREWLFPGVVLREQETVVLDSEDLAWDCRPGFTVDEDGEFCVREIILDTPSCDDIRAPLHVIRVVIPMPQGDPYVLDIPLRRLERKPGMTEFCDQEMGWIGGVAPDDEYFHSGLDDCGP